MCHIRDLELMYNRGGSLADWVDGIYSRLYQLVDTII